MKLNDLIIIIKTSVYILAILIYSKAFAGKPCDPDYPDCPPTQQCNIGLKQCIAGCGGLTQKGCCYNDTIVGRCTNNDQGIWWDDCTFMYDGVCGWDSTKREYKCVKKIDNKTTFMEDPSGEFPRECHYGGCEDCQEGQLCVLDRCIWPGAIPEHGCCYKGWSVNRDYSPQKKPWGLELVSCKGQDRLCVWDDIFKDYFCMDESFVDNTTVFQEDPSGENPRECNFVCTPDCEDKECGDDGCGGTCGKCGPGEICTKAGKCCKPDCAGKQCGDDGCGGSCGKCEWPYFQCERATGQCVYSHGLDPMGVRGCPDCECEQCVCEISPRCCYELWDDQCALLCKWDCGGSGPCIPDCEGKQCGDDGCEGQCGYCKDGFYCNHHQCKPCHTCADYQCGRTECGVDCGDCPEGEVCNLEHRCVPLDKQCAGLECGPRFGQDTCGKCKKTVLFCHQGQCLDCTDSTNKCLNRGKDGCGADACGNYCGPSSCYDSYWDGHYMYGSCYPYCYGYECGEDHCGGSCGECDDGYQCISHHCKPTPDCEAPEPAPEPVPDIAEDVHVGYDVVEVRDLGSDPGKPGMDAHKDAARPEISTDSKTGHHDAIGADTTPKSSGGGCTTGPGTAYGIWLTLLGVFALFLRRVRDR